MFLRILQSKYPNTTAFILSRDVNFLNSQNKYFYLEIFYVDTTLMTFFLLDIFN